MMEMQTNSITNDVVFAYQPQPKQKRFHFTTTDPKWFANEVLYGGAAGGGKSAAVVADAFKNAVKYPGIKILIVRKTLPELEGSILLTQREWYPQSICKYKEQKKKWVFNNRSEIFLGFCETEQDVYKYQGKEFEFVYIDEATHFTEFQYQYLRGRTRSSNRAFKALGGNPQTKLTTNPGGIGHSWIKKRFIDIGEFEKVHDIEEFNPVTKKIEIIKRVFIPAKLTDNQYLDTSYALQLTGLSKEMQKQLIDGSWDSLEGMFFDIFNRDIHVIEPFEIPKHWRKFRMMDEGYNDPFVCLWAAISPENKIFIYKEFAQSKLLSSEQAEVVNRMTMPDEKIDYSVGDTSFWNKGKTSGESPAEVFLKAGIPLIQATKERVNGWKRIREWLQITEDTDVVSGEKYKSSNLMIFTTCTGLVESITSMVMHKFNPEDIAEHPLDHHVDALRYGLMTRPVPRKEEVVNTLTPHERWLKEMEEKHFKSIMKTNRRGRW